MAVWRDIDSDVRINGSLVLPSGSLTIGGNNIMTLINGKVDTSRSITAGTGLTGGGDFTANRTISVNFGTVAGTVAEGNHGHEISGINGLTDALAGKASTTHNHNTVYLGINATAADSTKFNGQLASYYATSSALTTHTGDSSIHKNWGNWDTATNDFRVNAKVLLSHNTTTNKIFINPGKAFAGVDIVGSATVDGNGIWHAGNLSKTDFITATDPASVVGPFTVKGRIYAGDATNAGSILIKDSAFQDTIRLGGTADDSKTKAWIGETGYARFRNTVRVAGLEIDTSSMIANLNAEYLSGYRADAFVRAISVRDIAGYGVSHGFAVTSQSPISNSVSISAGLVLTDSGKRFETTAVQQLAMANAPGSGYDRIDIIYIIGSKTKDTNGAYISTGVNEGTVSVYQGAAVNTGSPTAPYTSLYAEYPDAIPLAQVYRPALVNDVDADKITDVRKYAALTSPKDATVEVRRKLNVSDEVTATKFNGSGAGLTNIPTQQFISGQRFLKTNQHDKTMYLDDVQSITANKTFTTGANLYFAGGTSYWVNTAGSARFNQVNVVNDLVIDKAGNYSRIKFPAQTNDPGEITHYESNNTSVMYFSASDDPGDTDYFSFGSRTPGSTYLEGARITTAGNATFAGITGTGLTVNGNTEIVGELKSGGPNEFPDPLVASQSALGWGSATFDSTQIPPGTNAVGAIKITANGDNHACIYDYKFDVKPSEYITASAYVFSTSSGKTTQMHIQWLKADGTASTVKAYSSISFNVPTSWGRFSLTDAAPSDATSFKFRVDNDGGAGIIMYFSAFQVERGRTLTGFKPYAGGNYASFFDKGIKLGKDGEIHSAYNNNFIIKDHANGNVTLSAAGGKLYLGYQNTGNVYLSSNLTTTSDVKIADTAGKLYYQGSDIESRYVNSDGDTMSGDLSITKNNPWLTLDSSSAGGNGTDQGAGISIGESGYKGAAAIHVTYTGDGIGHIGMGAVDGTTNIPQYEAMRLNYTDNIVRFFNTPTVNGSTVWHSGNDGSGSGLDADKFDGLESSQFLRSDADGTATGSITIDNTSASKLILKRTSQSGNNSITFTHSTNTIYAGQGATTDFVISDNLDLVSNPKFRVNAANGDTFINGNKVWHAGNDGSGSGLDADTVDGKHAVDFLNASVGGTIDVDSTSQGTKLFTGTSGSWVNKGPSGHNGSALLSMNTHAGSYYSQLWFDTSGNNFYHRTIDAGSLRPWAKVWTDFNDGSGSGLDADLLDGLNSTDFLRSNGKAVDSDKLDGLDSSQFLRSDVSGTMSGTLTLTGNLNVKSGTLYSATSGKVSINKAANSEHPLHVKSNGSYQGVNIERTATTDVSGLSWQNADGNYTAHLAARDAGSGKTHISLYSGFGTAMSGLTENAAFYDNGEMWVRSNIKTPQNLYVGGGSGLNHNPSIDLAIGDSDTGFNWVSDGKVQTYANNVAVAEWTSTYYNMNVPVTLTNSKDLSLNGGSVILKTSAGVEESRIYGGGGFNVSVANSPGVKMAVHTGGINVDGSGVFKDKVWIGNFQLVDNPTEGSLDFVFTG